MTPSPQDIHRKIQTLQLQLDAMENQLRLMNEAVGPLVSGPDSETSRAAKRILDAAQSLADVARSRGEAEIAAVRQLLESVG